MRCNLFIGYYKRKTRRNRDLKKMENTKNQNKTAGNIKIGLILCAAVTLIFAITIVKLKQGSLLQGYDHVLRQNLVEKNEEKK